MITSADRWGLLYCIRTYIFYPQPKRNIQNTIFLKSAINQRLSLQSSIADLMVNRHKPTFHTLVGVIATFGPRAHPWGCSWTSSPGWRSDPTPCTRWGLSATCWCSGDWGPAGCCWGETRWSQTGQQLHWPQPKGQRCSVMRTLKKDNSIALVPFGFH